MRIVSLACSNTEIVCALGCADYLVGVDDHSDRPANVIADLPRVGPDLEIDIDAVCELEPDLVLASLTVPGHEAVIEGLEEAGLEYLAPEPVSLKDVYEDIRLIAHALGVASKGEDLILNMKQHMSLMQTLNPAPKILVQWWNRPSIVPAKYSWVTDMITLAGAENPLGLTKKKSTPIEDSDIALINPDAIILSWCGIAFDKYRPDVIYKNPAWQEVKAIRNQHVFCVPEAHLGRPSTGLIEGFDALKEIVRKVAKHA